MKNAIKALIEVRSTICGNDKKFVELIIDEVNLTATLRPEQEARLSEIIRTTLAMERPRGSYILDSVAIAGWINGCHA